MNLVKIKDHVFVTKLAGFEHSEYIQPNETKKRINSDDIPLVQGKNIRNGNFVEKYDWFINKNISDKLIRSKLNKECILIPYVGSNLGEVGIFYHPYDCHLASNIAKIELIDDYFDIEFLKYYLQSPVGQSYLFQSKQGSAQPNITMESIRDTLVIDFSKEEQRKIASFLKTIDNLINNLNEINYNDLLEKTYYYWFHQMEFPDDKGKPYASNHIGIEKPDDWIYKDFSEISNISTGKKDANFATENGKYNFFTCSQKTMKCDEYDFNCKAILIAGNGDFNVKHYTGKFNAYQRTYVVEPKNSEYYGVLYLAAKSMIDAFKSGSNGSIVKFITLDDVKRISVLIPSNHKYLEYLNSIIDIIENNDCVIEQLQKLKNIYLPLLFNQQLKIED